jgi:hypothetical protein
MAEITIKEASTTGQQKQFFNNTLINEVEKHTRQAGRAKAGQRKPYLAVLSSCKGLNAQGRYYQLGNEIGQQNAS